MRVVELDTFKENLSDYLRLVAPGETIRIRDREAIVADGGPPMAGSRRAPRKPILRWSDLARELDQDRGSRS